MAVVYAEELFDRRSGSADVEGKATYSRTWEVRTDDPLDGPKVASAAAAIPARGQPYVTENEADPFALAQDAQVEQSSEDATLWYVTVKYASRFDWPTGAQPSTAAPGSSGASGQAPDPGEQPANPLDRPPSWRCSFQTTQKVAEYEFASGEPILNSAGLPFDPPVMRDVSYPVISLTRNVAEIDFTNLQLLQDAVNEFAWCGFPARSVRVTGIEFGSAFENEIPHWQITYQLAIKQPNWDIKLLNAGYTEKVAGAWVAITDANGKEPTEPAPLAADGTKLTPAGTPIFLTFRVYPERDFGAVVF